MERVGGVLIGGVMCTNLGGGKGSGRNTPLPKLQGSEKQVAWAEDIRKGKLDYLAENEKKCTVL